MATSKEKSTAKKTKRPAARSSSRSDYVLISAAKGIGKGSKERYKSIIKAMPRLNMQAQRNPIETRVSRLLTGKAIKPQRMIEIVRIGLPVMSVKRIVEGLGMESAEPLLPIIGMSNRTYARRKKSNQDLTPLESDRLYRLAKIESLAESVLGDQETANDWLQRPNRALGAVPLTLLDTEAGTEQVETILTRIEHGVYS